MNKHCQGCKNHHNAGRLKPPKHLQKFNDWCCAKGAPVDVGHCKQMNLKVLKNDNS